MRKYDSINSLTKAKLVLSPWLLYSSKEKEIAAMLQKGDEDAATISSLQKKIRELEAKVEELEEDLESERAIRKRVSIYFILGMVGQRLLSKTVLLVCVL